MNTITIIDATIESLFKTRNEQQMLKAFFYRVGLNMTPREAGKELGLSVNQINALNTARLYKLTDEGNNEAFKQGFKRANKSIKDFIQYKRSKNKTKELRGLANRMSFKHEVLMVKQQS